MRYARKVKYDFIAQFLQHKLLNDFSYPAALVIGLTHIVADSADFVCAICNARSESGCADHSHIIVIISDSDDLRDILHLC